MNQHRLPHCDHPACSKPRVKGLHKIHHFLCAKSSHYHTWHHHKHHRKTHYVIMLVYLLMIFSIVVSTLTNFGKVLAANNTWDFSIPADYTVGDTNKIEVGSNSARLKVNNYANDANTSALYHLDETEGAIATDSSTNNNTATVYNSPTWEAGKLNNGLTLNGSTQYLSVPDSASLSPTNQITLEAYTKFPTAFGNNSGAQIQSIIDKGDYQLYYDDDSGKIVFELKNANAGQWSQVGGYENDVWDIKINVQCSAILGTNLYVGTGYNNSDGEVWKFDGTIWTKIGGDGINGSWEKGPIEDVLSMATLGTDLYVGLGDGTGDGEVWKFDGITTWTKIGGDTINSSWANATYEQVTSLASNGTNVFAGLGTTDNDAEVWMWNGSIWSQIGGDGTGWGSNYNVVWSMTSNGTIIYAGLGSGTGEAEVWKWEDGSWSKIGGDGTGWADNTYEYVLSLYHDGNILYAGLGTGTGDGELWKLEGGTWNLLGGDGTGWAATFESVRGITKIGDVVYAAMGQSDAGEAELFKYEDSTWTKIGGDGVNSSWGGDYYMTSLTNDGVNLYATTSNCCNHEAEVWKWNGSAWTQLGGSYINKSWGYIYLGSAHKMAIYNDKLYVSMGVAIVMQFDGTNWNYIGGQGINESWPEKTYETLDGLYTWKGHLYAGLGSSNGDSEVWRWNDSVWEKVGGDTEKGSWNSAGISHVRTFSNYQGNLIAGLGDADDAQIWSFNGGTWSQMAVSWSASLDNVYSLVNFRGNLYAGLGRQAGEAEVWKYNGINAWTKIGGDGENSSWDAVNYDVALSLAVYNNELYVGLGIHQGEAEVWKWNDSTWTQVGGDLLNGGWGDSPTIIRALTVHNGDLYAGVEGSTGDGKLWKWNGSSWTRIGGDGVDSSWGTSVTSVSSIISYKGKLYAGLNSAQIWTYENNGYLQSSAVSQDTNWHHIAATYDGSAMKIYIDGIENASVAKSITIKDSTNNLLIGTDYGTRRINDAQGFFTGSLDEVRISNIARTSFNTTQYSADAQTVRPATAVLTSQVKSWDGFSTSETPNGGSLTYRLSSDGGSTWKYWDSGGGAWTTSASTSQANSQVDIATNISTFSITENGLMWQAILDGDGTQLVTLNSVTLTYTSDITAPTNPSLDHAYNEEGGAIELTTDTWYAYGQPYFTWAGATDTGGSGVSGYYIYYGTNAAGNPTDYQTAANYKASSLTSGSTYYLRIKTRDNAFNSSVASTLFIYKYNAGGNAPTAPQNITHQKCVSLEETPNCSGGNTSAINPSTINRFSFSWDEPIFYLNSISGYYYSVNVEPNETNTSSTANKYLEADAFATQQGKNTLYVVAKDSTGNISYSNYATVDFYATTSAPGIPQNLSAIDSSNRSVNQYRVTITWTAPGEGVVDNYKVFRSTDNNTYAQIGSTASTAYIESDLSTSTTYYYKIKASDSAGSDSAYSEMVNKNPTGKYTEPPTITTLPSAVAGANNMTVTWDTDRVSEAIVEVGTTTAYGINGLSLDPAIHHEITVSGLIPGTDYHYRVQSLDPGELRDYSSTDGKSADYTFSTQPAPGMSDVSFSDITTNSAILTFKTTKASVSTIEYGSSLNYGNTITDESSGSTTQHTIRFANLLDGTTYQVKISIRDADGNNVTSTGFSFRTLEKPKIFNFQLQPVADAAVTTYDVVWSSNVPISSSVVFSASGKSPKSSAKGDLETEHTLRVEGLEDQATYSITVSGRDQFGNMAEYTAPSVTTPIDTRAPKLSNLTIEVRASGVGTSQKAQIIASWETDEPATSMVEYDQGISGDTYSFKSQQDQAYSTTHVVILSELEPSKIYHLRAVSIDKAGNQGNSPDTSAITGKIQKSIIDIILNSLINSFGWLGKVFK